MRNATLTWNLLLFVPACAFAGLPLTISGQTKGETDQREIEGRMFVDAWNRHDAKGFAAVFAEDADFTKWRGTGVSGRSNIEEFHAPISRPSSRTVTRAIGRSKPLFIRPDLAAVDVRWEMTGPGMPRGIRGHFVRGLLSCDGEECRGVANSADAQPGPDCTATLSWAIRQQRTHEDKHKFQSLSRKAVNP
jgi:uncharacterized protein (TIGR02246 family)